MSYRINEGRLNVAVAQDSTVNVLMLEPWNHGAPLNLTISRGMKQPEENLQESVARQVQDMSGQLEAFVWKGTQLHQAPRLTYTTGRYTYRMGETAIEQCMAVTQLTETHLLFLFLSSAQPLDETTLRQWRHILDSFEPDHGPLPASLLSAADDQDEDN